MTFARRYWAPLDRWVSPLGLGAWQLAGLDSVEGRPNGWPAIERRAARILVQQALEAGVELVDTAQGYGDGRSEAIIGEALVGLPRRSLPVICTKVKVTREEEARGRLGRGLQAKVEESLQRLKVEAIDVLLLHGPSDDLDWPNFDPEELEVLRDRGLIRCYGVSSRGLTGALGVIRSGWGQCVQWTFNLLERRAETLLLPLLKNSGQLFMARSPLSGGLLTEKFARSGPTWGSDEYRATWPEAFQVWAKVQVESSWDGARSDLDLSELALRYVLGDDRVAAVVCGARSPDHVSSMFSFAAAGPLPASRLKAIEGTWGPFFPGWG